VDVELSGGAVGRAAVPSGASTGQHEAWNCATATNPIPRQGRIEGGRQRQHEIFPELEGRDALDQIGIDRTMIALDGTANKGKLGANAILGVSLATAHAAASQLGMDLFKYLGGPNAKVLPVPMMNILNGARTAMRRSTSRNS